MDFFGGDRIGFIKLKAEVSNDDGEKLPGSVFLRGGSVGMLVRLLIQVTCNQHYIYINQIILQPDDVPADSETDKHVLLAIQPRIPAGSLSFAEIPAGMLDDSGSFSGGAAKEIKEETGLEVSNDELLDMTHLALSSQTSDVSDATGENLQEAVYPSPGGSDEFIPLFLCQKRIKREEMKVWQGKLTGLRDEGEKITIKLVPLDRLWREGARDGKTLAALALYEGLRRDGKIKPSL